MKMRPPLSILAYKYLLRRLPIRSGLTALSFNKVVNSLLDRCDTPVWTTYIDGTPVETAVNDHDGRILYLFGTNDPKVSHVSMALLRSGDVFLDIGANYASVGLQAVHAVGKAGNVHLFEPQRKLCDRVEQAIKAAGHTNVHMHRIGLLDKDGSFTLMSPPDHTGKATFAAREDIAGWEQTECCEVRNIAEYVVPLVSGQAFGAKLDIEGSEPKVLPWLLSQSNLRFLIFEAIQNHDELYRGVMSSGLSLYGLYRHPFLLRIVRVDSLEQMHSYHDLLAVRLPHDMVKPGTINPYVLGRQLAGRQTI